MTSAILWDGLAVKGLIEASNGTQIGVVTTMPTASSKLKGCAVLYAGTSGTYANGALYQCTLSGSTYAWTKIDAPTAAKLTSAKSLEVALGSTAAASFDGSADATSIGVSGTLSVANGGTGATSAADARTNLGLGSAATLTPYSNTWNNGPVVVRSGDGVMEVGKYFDFHVDSTSTKDYDVRITAASTGLTISGTTSGTFKGDLTGTASKATADASGNTITSTYAKKPIVVQDASVTWASDTTYSDFPYKGTITVSGCTASHIPSVTFSVDQAVSGNYCPVSESATNVVYIWSKVNTATSIPVVVAMPQ